MHFSYKINIDTPSTPIELQKDTSQYSVSHETERFFLGGHYRSLDGISFDKKIGSLKSIESLAHHLSASGEFSLVLVNKADKTISLLRDGTGTRGLYYSVNGRDVLVSSNIFKLLESLEHRKFSSLGVEILLNYEYQLDPFTILENVFSLKRGHSLQIKPSSTIADQKRFTKNLSEIEENSNFDIENFSLREKIIQAHEKRLSSNHAAIMLSGGIDSTVMGITLKKDLGVSNLEAFTFSTKNAEQSEVEDAKKTAKQLDVKLHHVEVDPNKDLDLEKVFDTNFPYVGCHIFNELLSDTSSYNFYAGQDNRLHTPHSNIVDKVLLGSLANNEGLRKLMSSSAKIVPNSLLPGILKKAQAHLIAGDDLNQLMHNFYFHIHPGNKGQQASKTIIEALEKNSASNPKNSLRQHFNNICDIASDFQHTDDIACMTGTIESLNSQCSMPFFDVELCEYSASLPMAYALKKTKGREGHGKKTKHVDKFVLRKAYASELSDDLIYRDKAVCHTNHLYLNGFMSAHVNEYLNSSVLAKTEMSEHLPIKQLVNRMLTNDQQWKIKDYEAVVESQNILYLELIARKFNVS